MKTMSVLIVKVLVLQVYKNLELFMQGKQAGDDLFDRLSVSTIQSFLRRVSYGYTLAAMIQGH